MFSFARQLSTTSMTRPLSSNTLLFGRFVGTRQNEGGTAHTAASPHPRQLYNMGNASLSVVSINWAKPLLLTGACGRRAAYTFEDRRYEYMVLAIE